MALFAVCLNNNSGSDLSNSNRHSGKNLHVVKSVCILSFPCFPMYFIGELIGILFWCSWFAMPVEKHNRNMLIKGGEINIVSAIRAGQDHFPVGGIPVPDGWETIDLYLKNKMRASIIALNLSYVFFADSIAIDGLFYDSSRPSRLLI